jgi:hypothetical protein
MYVYIYVYMFGLRIVMENAIESLVRKNQLQIAEQRLNLSRSQQPGHSTAYNTPFHYLSRMQRIYPLKQFKL